jgi:uncharacterized protein
MKDEGIALEAQKGLSKESGILAVYIFGSYAKKLDSKESDIDVAVVVENKKSITEDYVYDLIKDVPFPKDLDLSVVDKTSSPLFLFQIIKTGKRIYTKDAKIANSFEAYVLREYYDTQHIRNIYDSYLKQKFSQKTYADR